VAWVAKNRTEEDAAADVPHFLSFKSLKPFVDKHLGDLQSIIVKYRTERGNIAHGIKAEIIPKICDVWLDADEAKTLGARQKQIAQRARFAQMRSTAPGVLVRRDQTNRSLRRAGHEHQCPWPKLRPIDEVAV
jgi:hypothetical protein